METGILFRNGSVWLSDVRRAVAWKERMRGLLFRPPLETGQGLLIESCNAVHTIGMRYALDLVFVDADGRVCRIRRNVRSGRLVWGGWRARRVLEVSAGTLTALDFPAETRLSWRPQAPRPRAPTD